MQLFCGPRKQIDHFMGFVSGILLERDENKAPKVPEGHNKKNYLARNLFVYCNSKYSIND